MNDNQYYDDYDDDEIEYYEEPEYDIEENSVQNIRTTPRNNVSPNNNKSNKQLVLISVITTILVILLIVGVIFDIKAIKEKNKKDKKKPDKQTEQVADDDDDFDSFFDDDDKDDSDERSEKDGKDKTEDDDFFDFVEDSEDDFFDNKKSQNKESAGGILGGLLNNNEQQQEQQTQSPSGFFNNDEDNDDQDKQRGEVFSGESYQDQEEQDPQDLTEQDPEETSPLNNTRTMGEIDVAFLYEPVIYAEVINQLELNDVDRLYPDEIMKFLKFYFPLTPTYAYDIYEPVVDIYGNEYTHVFTLKGPSIYEFAEHLKTGNPYQPNEDEEILIEIGFGKDYDYELGEGPVETLTFYDPWAEIDYRIVDPEENAPEW